jgi:DNA-binding HxlR family transcriptional regulator
MARKVTLRGIRDSTRPTRRSDCPVACALDLLGDRWTLLLVRDLFGGKERYGEFLNSSEKIPTNILADRLVRLEEHGIILRKPYQTNPPRYTYQLTPRGETLRSVLGALAMWGSRNVKGTVASKQIRAALQQEG